MKLIKKLLSMVLCLTFICTVFYFNSSASDVSDFSYTTLSNGTVRIDKYKGNDSEVTIPDYIDGYDVTAIDFMAFARCVDVEKIIIGKNMKSIGNGAFSNCSSLKKIVVSDENIAYSVENDVLFNKDKTEIICYPSQKGSKAYIMPNSVELLKMRSFSKCSFLEEIELSENLKTISMSSFVECERLQSIIMSSSVASIEQDAFDSCSEFNIYYKGNQEQWNNINIDGTDNKTKLNNAVIFNDNDKNYNIKLSDKEIQLTYSSKAPFELKVSNNSILKVEGTPKENASGLYEVTAKITPLKSGTSTVSAVAENDFVLCNFNYTVEKCNHNLVFYETLKAEICTEDGKQLFKCEYCDYSEEKTTDATGHSMGEWKVETKATKDHEGLEVRKCTNYNCDYTEEKVIPKTSSATEPETKPDNSSGNTSTDFLYGDVDRNHKINATDARKVLRYVAGLEELNSNQLKAANVDGNKKVTASDARRILRHVAGLESL